MIIKLHTKSNLSTYRIAKMFNMKANSIIVLLRNKGLLRKNIGWETENAVIDWFQTKGMNPICQRGDAPFDILLAGKRIDIKGGHEASNGRYHFGWQYTKTIHKKTSEDLDQLLLVFLDEDKRPMYLVNFSDIEHLVSLNIRFRSPKYPMTFLGCLDREVSVI